MVAERAGNELPLWRIGRAARIRTVRATTSKASLMKATKLLVAMALVMAIGLRLPIFQGARMWR